MNKKHIIVSSLAGAGVTLVLIIVSFFVWKMIQLEERLVFLDDQRILHAAIIQTVVPAEIINSVTEQINNPQTK